MGLSLSIPLLRAQPALLAIGAGVLAGAVTGSAIVASGVLWNPAPAQLSLVACPGGDRVVARVNSGQSMLVTARSGDGLWLELYIGEPGLDTGWAPTTALRFEGSTGELPVEDCRSLVAAASHGASDTAAPTPGLTFIATVGPVISLAPGATLPPTPRVTAPSLPAPTPTLVPGGSPPPPTTPPSATPTQLPPPTILPTPVPTPMPDLTGPTISTINVVATLLDGRYYIDNAENECGRTSSASITAFISDSSGVNTSTIFLRYYDSSGDYHSQPMILKFGTKATFTSSISDAGGTWPSGEIVWWIVARDNLGNLRTTGAPPDSAHRLFRSHCFL